MTSTLGLASRTGPIGRSVRFGFVVVIALTLASIVGSQGSARFRNPHILTEPSAWFLHGVMLVVFVLTIGVVASGLFGDRVARRVQLAGILFAATAALIAGVIGWAVRGSVWGYPLADLVWYFDVSMLIVEGLAFVLAIALGTPGCEIGVWRELLARGTHRSFAQAEALACVVGIHLIDRWELGRRDAARARRGST